MPGSVCAKKSDSNQHCDGVGGGGCGGIAASVIAVPYLIVFIVFNLAVGVW